MSEPERGEVVYVTADSKQWMRIDVPSGLVSPPAIELHRPLAGPVVFYHADSYQLPVPEAASRRGLTRDQMTAALKRFAPAEETGAMPEPEGDE